MRAMLQALINVLINGRNKSTSQQCVKLLAHLYRSFEPAGRHQCLLFLFNKYRSHAGLTGYTVSLLKDELDQNLAAPSVDPHFQGGKLLALLNHVYALPGGEKSDLLEQSESIMAALNLVRYLLIRDKANATLFWDHIGLIEDKYLAVLRKGVDISKAHYQLDIDKLKKGGKEAAMEMEFMVGGDQMPGLSKDQQMNVLHMALHTFEMMESVMGRVVELIDHRRVEMKPDLKA